MSRGCARAIGLVAGAAISAGFALVALIALAWTPYDPTAINIPGKLQAPSFVHWFGTDQNAAGRFKLLCNTNRPIVI